MLLWIHDTGCEAKLISAKFLMLGDDLSVWNFLSSKTFPWLLMSFQSSMTFHDFSRKFYFSRFSQFSRPCGNPVISGHSLSWWRLQMETFSALLALCTGNSLVTGEFHAQRPMSRSFDVFFDLCRNKPLSKQSRGWWFEMSSRPLWRHCNGVN